MQAASAPPSSAPATSPCPPPAAAGPLPPRRACCSTGAPELPPFATLLLCLCCMADMLASQDLPHLVHPGSQPKCLALRQTFPVFAVWTRAWCLTPLICQRMSPQQPHSRRWARCGGRCDWPAWTLCASGAPVGSAFIEQACSASLPRGANPMLVETVELGAGGAPQGAADGDAAERPKAGAARGAQVGAVQWVGRVGRWLWVAPCWCPACALQSLCHVPPFGGHFACHPTCCGLCASCHPPRLPDSTCTPPCSACCPAARRRPRCP